MWPPRENKHVEDSLRFLFALKPRLRLECRDALRIILGNVEEKGCRRLAFAPWDEQCVETGVAAAVSRAGGIW